MSEQNKGQVIGNILKKHAGQVSSADVVTEAAAVGVDTTVNYVRLVRSQLTKDGELPRMRQRKEKDGKRRRHGKPNSKPAPIVANGFTASDLLAVRALSQRFGVALKDVPGKVTEAVNTLESLAQFAS